MGKPRVMLIDDNVDIQEYLKMLCEMEGYEVLQALNGRQALKLLEDQLVPPNLIFLDVMMPVMDGLEFQLEFTSNPAYNRCRAPVIVLSASGDRIPANVQGFLRKPVELDDLVILLDRHRS